MHGSQEGLAAWAAVRHGLAGEPGRGARSQRLVEWQWPDGGWNCDRHPSASHSSFNESFAAIRALGAYAAAGRAARRWGATPRPPPDARHEFLLVHGVVHSHRTGRLAHPDAGRAVLAAVLALRPPHRAARARWTPDGWPTRGPPRPWTTCGRAPRATAGGAPTEALAGTGRRSAPGVEAVDWTADGSAKVLTLQAVEVLRAAGAA